LISTAVANKVKDKYYATDLPMVENVSKFQNRKHKNMTFLSRNSVSQDFDENEQKKFQRCTTCFTERLQTQLVERFGKVLLLAQRLQVNHLENLKERISHVETKINSIQPSEDQLLFIDHNVRPFTTPDDWKFEPCAVHYDTVSNLPLPSLPNVR
jgi:hypothetical protein